MTTIKEVAKRAGVSVGTASNVINGAVPVSPARRELVLAAIRDLGYQPSDVARSLKLRRTHMLGLVVSDITNPFFAQLVRGAEEAALAEGYLLLTFNTDDRIEREKHVLGVLRGRRVDGILLVVAPMRGASSHIAETIARGTPVVCLDRVPRGVTVDSVTVDNVRAARECVEHLLEMRHRRIGILTGSMLLATARGRLRGYRQALQAHGLSVDPELVREGDFRMESGYKLASELLSGSGRPTALFVSNGLMAIGALRAVADLGLRCPEDVALATFDDLPLSEVLSPPLTSVAQPAYQMGYQGAKILFDRIKSKRIDGPIKIRLHAQLKVRQSTACAPSMVTKCRRPEGRVSSVHVQSLGKPHKLSVPSSSHLPET
jgi:LacI family transcriptional regulator